MSYPKVYIIILNWNGALDTLGCIYSLKKNNYPYYEIVVVDNGSTDDSVERIKKNHPDVTLIETGKNLGYASGNNVGIKYAIDKFAEYILILNNDTLVAPDFLSQLMSKATQTQKYSIFSPQIRLYPNKKYLWYAGGRIFWPFAQVQMYCRNKFLPCAKGAKNKKTNFISGAALFAKAEVFKKIGGFDKRFFCYWEEADWEARAMKKGFEMSYVPESVIYHKVAKSSGGEGNPKMQYYFYRNNLLFAQKNLPPLYWLSFLPFYVVRLFIYELIRGIINFILLKPNRLLGWLYSLRGLFDFIRRKFGKVLLSL